LSGKIALPLLPENLGCRPMQQSDSEGGIPSIMFH
jgi:hypothetical protein